MDPTFDVAGPEAIVTLAECQQGDLRIDPPDLFGSGPRIVQVRDLDSAVIEPPGEPAPVFAQGRSGEIPLLLQNRLRVVRIVQVPQYEPVLSPSGQVPRDGDQAPSIRPEGEDKGSRKWDLGRIDGDAPGPDSRTFDGVEKRPSEESVRGIPERGEKTYKGRRPDRGLAQAHIAPR